MRKISIGISTLANTKSRAIELAISINQNDTKGFIDTISIVSQGELAESSYCLNTNVVVYETVEKGLSKSRNALLDSLSSDYVWLIDDDVEITKKHLDKIYEIFTEKPNHDLFIGKVYCSDKNEFFKNYKKNRHGYIGALSVSSIEMIINKKFLFKYGIRYNAELGLGAKYPCGEENELLIRCLNHGASINFLDEIFISHPSISSLNKSDYFSTREQLLAKKIVAKILPLRFRLLYVTKVLLYLAFYKKDIGLLLYYLNPCNKAVE